MNRCDRSCKVSFGLSEGRRECRHTLSLVPFSICQVLFCMMTERIMFNCSSEWRRGICIALDLLKVLNVGMRMYLNYGALRFLCPLLFKYRFELIVSRFYSA